MNDKNTNNEPLTEKQRELAEKNHDLIYGYAHKKNISIGEYYDLLAIGLCKAAKTYDENKGRFSTLAYKCMENELNTYWKSLNKKSVIPSELILSYDAPITSTDLSDNNCKLIENIPDSTLHNGIASDIMFSTFMNILNNKETLIVNMLIDGLTHKEIAEKLGCRKQNISYHVKKIREKAIDFLV